MNIGTTVEQLQYVVEDPFGHHQEEYTIQWVHEILTEFIGANRGHKHIDNIRSYLHIVDKLEDKFLEITDKELRDNRNYDLQTTALRKDIRDHLTNLIIHIKGERI